MKKVLETARFFFVSPEFVVVILGVVMQLSYGVELEQLLEEVKIADEPLKYISAIPVTLCIWSFVSGRKLLFPDKDKVSILQRWPDYWRLRIGFHVALSWNVIFAIAAIIAWGIVLRYSMSIGLMTIVISIIGSAFCSLSVYIAQTRVEEEVLQFKGLR